MPVDDRPLRNRRSEPVSVAYDPCGEHTPSTAAGDEEVVLINESTIDRRIYPGHQVIEVLTGIEVINPVHEVLAVSGASSRIHPQHCIPIRSKVLPVPVPANAVHGDRPAMNPEQHWILPARLEVGGPHEPSLYPKTI